MRYLREERGLDPSQGLSLHSAAREGQLEVTRYLISSGVEVNTRDDRGRTPLFLSVSGQHTEVTKALLEAGEDLDSQDQHGVTVKSLARKEDMIKLLQCSTTYR